MNRRAHQPSTSHTKKKQVALADNCRAFMALRSCNNLWRRHDQQSRELAHSFLFSPSVLIGPWTRASLVHVQAASAHRNALPMLIRLYMERLSDTSATTPLVVESTRPTTNYLSNVALAAETVSPLQRYLSNSEAVALLSLLESPDSTHHVNREVPSCSP